MFGCVEGVGVDNCAVQLNRFERVGVVKLIKFGDKVRVRGDNVQVKLQPTGVHCTTCVQESLKLRTAVAQAEVECDGREAVIDGHGHGGRLDAAWRLKDEVIWTRRWGRLLSRYRSHD